MYFNSLDFALFLPIVFAIYWIIPSQKIQLQNLILLIASYIFYAFWDWRFLSLLIFSTLSDYFIGLYLSRETKRRNRKILLVLSISINIGLLGFFKYFNFFIENFNTAFSFLGYQFNSFSLSIILPVGISFYTFQTLSYSIDIYRKNIRPTRSIISFAAFVSFFPQLVAGPIERAKNLLPQFFRKRNFNYNEGINGLKQILWGLFKKIVIADNCAIYVNMIFNNSENLGGNTLLLGAILFAFQIYGDFSGYSDIAIGTARLFGFKLMQNFSYPYFSRNIGEFWRRWHISLSTWFRDYLYIPLGGSRGSISQQIRNILIIFLVSGFWHGAKWTFVFWGFIHAVYFLPLLIFKRNRKYIDIVAKKRHFPKFQEVFKICITFGLVVFSWIFFRSENLTQAWNIIYKIISPPYFSMPGFKKYYLFTLIIIFLIIEWNGRESKYAIENLTGQWKTIYRFIFYYVITMTVLFFTNGESEDFIYFQF